MCRWMAYSGNAITLSDLIFDTEHSLVDQSLSARSSVETTNGDGFGIGWYDDCEQPGVYKHIQPAWNDLNLMDLCRHTKSQMFLAHVRAATSTSIQQSNCHPFRHGRWLFVHNGVIRNFRSIRRDLALEIGADLYSELSGSADSEIMFLLALHFGMADDVYGGLARMVGFVETVGRQHGIEFPMQMTLGIADGVRLYALRYSSEHDSRSLYFSESVAALRRLVPAELQERLDHYSESARTVVSEPFHDLPGAWQAVPESSFLEIEAGDIRQREFVPVVP